MTQGKIRQLSKQVGTNGEMYFLQRERECVDITQINPKELPQKSLTERLLALLVFVIDRCYFTAEHGIDRRFSFRSFVPLVLVQILHNRLQCL